MYESWNYMFRLIAHCVYTMSAYTESELTDHECIIVIRTCTLTLSKYYVQIFSASWLTHKIIHMAARNGAFPFTGVLLSASTEAIWLCSHNTVPHSDAIIPTPPLNRPWMQQHTWKRGVSQYYYKPMAQYFNANLLHIVIVQISTAGIVASQVGWKKI